MVVTPTRACSSLHNLKALVYPLLSIRPLSSGRVFACSHVIIKTILMAETQTRLENPTENLLGASCFVGGQHNPHSLASNEESRSASDPLQVAIVPPPCLQFSA